MKKALKLLFVCLLFLVGCSKDPLVGRWVRPVEGQAGQVQGMALKADGTASSINMETLVYQTWKRDGDVLRLTGQSIGNGQTIDVSEEYRIESLDRKQLTLRVADFVIVYHRD